jgi:hypothetical protein
VRVKEGKVDRLRGHLVCERREVVDLVEWRVRNSRGGVVRAVEHERALD